jgi:DNA-binding CsgD family transcriptional regulator
MSAGNSDKMITAEIRTKDGEVILIDAADVDLVRDYVWTVRRGPFGHQYAQASWKTKKVLLHRLIMNPGADQSVDHINNNGLDNRRCNLRLCTHAENMRNRKKHKNNSSGFKGVYPEGNRWSARITSNGVRHNLGVFETREEAHAAYVAGAQRLHGAFANPGDLEEFDTEDVPGEKVVVPVPERISSLSPTQKEILELIASGFMPVEICSQLGIAPTTVSTHLKRIKAKIGAKSTIHAAVMWARATDAAIAEYDSWGKV